MGQIFDLIQKQQEQLDRQQKQLIEMSKQMQEDDQSLLIETSSCTPSSF